MHNIEVIRSLVSIVYCQDYNGISELRGERVSVAVNAFNGSSVMAVPFVVNTFDSLGIMAVPFAVNAFDGSDVMAVPFTVNAFV